MALFSSVLNIFHFRFLFQIVSIWTIISCTDNCLVKFEKLVAFVLVNLTRLQSNSVFSEAMFSRSMTKAQVTIR